MLLPYMNEIAEKRKQIQGFMGYNHNPTIRDGELYDMGNLSSSLYPALSVRKPRGTVKKLTKVNGLFAKNKLIWVDGVRFYYDGVMKGYVSDTPKQFVSMGAYVLIFPDKLYYNTATGAFGSLENYAVVTGPITIQACLLDGTPTDAESGLYVKISGVGINSGFKDYDGIKINGCTVSSLNKPAVIQGIGTNYIIIHGQIESNTGQNGGLIVERTVPSMDFLTEAENRVWGCSSANHEIYACKLGDPFNWNCYEGISTDSYAVTVGSDGDFTGAITYLGYVMFFKEDCIHKVFGSKPSNYQVFETLCRGVAKGSEKSLAIVNETLYYLSRNGVVAYSGSFPDSVSYAFGDKEYKNGVGGAIGNKYYISLMDGTKHLMFVYDEKLLMWHKEDETNVSYFENLEGVLYYVSANKIMTVSGSDSEVVKWYAEFSDNSENTMNKKYVSKLQFKMELEEKSLFEVFIMYENNGLWEKIASISSKVKRSYNIPVSVKRSDYHKIKISGIGMCKLYEMVKTYTEGSDS